MRALEACARAGAEVVLFSGRRRANVESTRALIGQPSFIYEAGAVLVLDGEEEYLTGGLVPVDGRTIHDQIADSGAPALLLERFAGRLEYHDPWHLGRDISHLFRGEVDASEADALLAEHGHGELRLVDNGAIQPRRMGIAVERPRAYHLVPRAASKARAVARHQQARGYAPEDCIASATRARTSAPRRPSPRSGWWRTASRATRRSPTRCAPNARVCAEGLRRRRLRGGDHELAERR